MKSYIGILLLLILASCKVSQPYQRPELNTADLYRDYTGTDTSNVASLSFKRLFSDNVLSGLIEEGLAQN